MTYLFLVEMIERVVEILRLTLGHRIMEIIRLVVAMLKAARLIA